MPSIFPCRPKLNVVSTLIVNDLFPLLLLIVDTVSSLAALILAMVLDAVHLAAVQVTGTSRLLGALRSRLGLAILAIINAIAALVLVVAAATPASIATATGTGRGATCSCGIIGRITTRSCGIIGRITGSGGRGRGRAGALSGRRSVGRWGSKCRARSRRRAVSGRAWWRTRASLGCN